MSEYADQVDIEVEEELGEILPDGYAEGDDFFNPESWSGTAESGSAPDTPAETTETGNPTETETQTAPAMEQSEATETTQDSTEQQPEETPAMESDADTLLQGLSKRKVKYQFNHKDVEEEVDLDKDLPELMQKARSTDRYKERVGVMQKAHDRMSATAKTFGYDSVDAFMDAMVENAKNSERESMLAQGTAPEVADYILNQKYSVPQSASPEEEPTETTPTAAPEQKPERDFHAEALDLLKAYPDLRGQQLPDSVLAATAKGATMLEAYREYKEKADKAENERLRKENRILKDNADSADRAPVSGVTKGGSTDQKPDDPFLVGFNSEDW